MQLSALGNYLLGRFFKFRATGCDAAAGLTAVYNAPIAGAIFAAEIVLGSIAMERVWPIIVAAVVANIVIRALLGYQPGYEMPPFPAFTESKCCCLRRWACCSAA